MRHYCLKSWRPAPFSEDGQLQSVCSCLETFSYRNWDQLPDYQRRKILVDFTNVLFKSQIDEDNVERGSSSSSSSSSLSVENNLWESIALRPQQYLHLTVLEAVQGEMPVKSMRGYPYWILARIKENTSDAVNDVVALAESCSSSFLAFANLIKLSTKGMYEASEMTRLCGACDSSNPCQAALDNSASSRTKNADDGKCTIDRSNRITSSQSITDQWMDCPHSVPSTKEEDKFLGITRILPMYHEIWDENSQRFSQMVTRMNNAEAKSNQFQNQLESAMIEKASLEAKVRALESAMEQRNAAFDEVMAANSAAALSDSDAYRRVMEKQRTISDILFQMKERFEAKNPAAAAEDNDCHPKNHVDTESQTERVESNVSFPFSLVTMNEEETITRKQYWNLRHKYEEMTFWLRKENKCHTLMLEYLQSEVDRLWDHINQRPNDSPTISDYSWRNGRIQYGYENGSDAARRSTNGIDDDADLRSEISERAADTALDQVFANGSSHDSTRPACYEGATMQAPIIPIKIKQESQNQNPLVRSSELKQEREHKQPPPPKQQVSTKSGKCAMKSATTVSIASFNSLMKSKYIFVTCFISLKCFFFHFFFFSRPMDI